MSLSPRQLPSVDRLLQDPGLRALPRELVVRVAREVLEDARRGLRDGGWAHELTELAGMVAQRVEQASRPPLRSVINATGVVIHTNLGRAPLSAAALAAAETTAAGYANLEYDLEAGERGSRHELVSDLLKQLTGAEAALVVNNNAAAVLLVLSALAQGKEAIISRGQLVEIGGGFRIPDVMLQSGVSLIEVGTTNRTYAADYAAAVTERTALLLRVHTSNFAVVGFTHAAELSELVEVASAHGLPVIDDLGSGSLLDTSAYGLAKEPMVQESVAAGADLVAFSGDKLLGGPQAGVIVGKQTLIARLKKHPLTRAVRPDKLTLAALGATLVHYLRGEAEREVPVWRMLAASPEILEQRAHVLAGAVGGHVVDTRSAVGGGSLPGQTQSSKAVALDSDDPDGLAASLRAAGPPVVGRIDEGHLLLDLRTVLPEQDVVLREAVIGATHRLLDVP
jgi:L-seryl-tRNA(Ser) seleniumtransferase